MNLVLLFAEDFDETGRVRLDGRRFAHVRSIHRASVGDELCVGRVDGLVGTGRIVALDEHSLEMEVRLEHEPPPPSNVTLVLALPRPPVLRRVLIAATSMGVKRLVLLNARRVEKSYWQSHALADDAIESQLVLGLEQARDTCMPTVSLRQRFRPFVEDELPEVIARGAAWVADPTEPVAPAPREYGPVTLVVGPEGGWSDFELDRLAERGVRSVGLGPRILRVETVVPVLLSRFARFPGPV